MILDYLDYLLAILVDHSRNFWSTAFFACNTIFFVQTQGLYTCYKTYLQNFSQKFYIQQRNVPSFKFDLPSSLSCFAFSQRINIRKRFFQYWQCFILKKWYFVLWSTINERGWFCGSFNPNPIYLFSGLLTDGREKGAKRPPTP